MKQIAQLTANDFPNHYTHVRDLNIWTNLSGVTFNKSYDKTGLLIRGTYPRHAYVNISNDYANDNNGTPDFPALNDFHDIQIDNTNIIDVGSIGEAYGAFKNSNFQKDVFIYFVQDDTPAKPTTTTSYMLNSYTNGKVEQNYSALTKGSVITYTFTPNDGFVFDSASLYRFSGSTLTSVDFTKGVKIKDLTPTDNTYTISDDDLGNCLCVNATFKAEFKPHITDNIEHTTATYDKNTQAIVLTIDSGYIFKDATLNINDETKTTVNFTNNNGVISAVIPNKYQTSDYDFEVNGNVGTPVAKYTGTITPDSTTLYTYKLDKDTITITPIGSNKLSKVTGSVQPYPGDSRENITGTITDNIATLIIPSDELNNNSAMLHIYVKFVQTLESLGVTDETNKNAKLTISENTMTITPDTGYEVTNAKFYITNAYDFSNPPTETNVTNFLVANGIATLTLNNVESIPDNSVLHVSYETKNLAPEVVVYKGLPVKALDNTTIAFNNKDTWIVTCETGYHINSLHVDCVLIGEGEITQDIVTPVISSDKKSATFTVTDKNYLTLSNISLRGDIAKDFTPPEPSTGTDIIRTYVVTDDTLDEISKKNFTYYSDGHNQVYDFQSFINQLYKLPFNIPNSYLTTTSQIITGFLIVDAPAYKVNKLDYTLNLGYINVPVKNGFDYNLKDVSLILPWLATVKLNASDILGKKISIAYNLSLLDGSTTVVIKSDDVVINSFKTNIATNLELFNIYANKENGTLNTTLQNNLRQAYIKINYYKPVDNLISYPTNEHGILKDYTGFTKVKNVILNKSINSVIDSQIQGLLQQGIIIK